MNDQKTKICSHCKKEKSISEFLERNDKRSLSKRRSHCRDCNRKKGKNYYHKNLYSVRKKKREYWAKHPEQRAKCKLHYHYGITLEQYKEILLKQNGVCAICGKPETATANGKIAMLSVDHDHKTNKVRGLLCRKCNSFLGFADDNLEILLNSMRYLKFWSNVS